MVYDFGIRLRDLRKEKKMTQKQLASRLDVSKASVSGYENNIAKPDIDALKKLAALFGVTADYLLGLDDRRVIVLDDLTKEQADQLRQIADIFIQSVKAK